MRVTEEYAEQWDVSAKYFYDRGYYTWMARAIENHDIIVEIGCGTGYSTLSLIENGHRVIAIEKNKDCIEKAKRLLQSRNVDEEKIVFLEGDIAEAEFRENLISSFSFDAVVCWNVGTYWSKEMMEYYLPHMLEYGLERWQIAQNPESSYSELILWEACRLAKGKNVPVHIIDRSAEVLNETNDPYYRVLKDEFGFLEILYDNMFADSISNGGRMLSTNGNVNNNAKVNVIFLSLLMR